MRSTAWLQRTAACLFLLGGAALAQTDITSMSIEDLARTEVFSASRYFQKTIDAPASITIVTAEEIRQFGYRTLADIVANARDFYISNDRNYVYVGVRGFARPGDYNSRLLLLVDGHRINDPVYDQGEFDRTLPMDIDLIDRVEIVRGGTSSLYGTNAMLAVVNVITRKGAALHGVEVSSELGALGAYGGRLSFGRQFKHGVDLLASISAVNSNGEQKIYFPEYDTAATNFGLAEGLDGERARSAYVSLAARGIAFRGAYGRRFKLVPTATFGSLFNLRESTVDATGYADVTAEKKIRGWVLRAHSAFDSYIYDGVYSTEAGAPPYLDYARAKWWTADLLVSSNLGQRQRVQFGGEFRYATRRAQFSSANDIGMGALSDPLAWSFFVQDDVKLTRYLQVVGGIRYDDLGAGSKASPRLAAVFKPRESTALKFLASSAFRAPNAYEQAYGQYQLQLPSLQPERIQSFEAIVEHSLRQGVRVSLSAFKNGIDDLISQTARSATDIGYVNGNDVDTYGFSVEVAKRFQSGWYLRGAWSAQRSFDPGTRLVISNSPTHLLKTAVLIPLFRQHVDLGITNRFASGVENIRGLPVARQNLTDLTLSSTRLIPNPEVAASLYNLFDSHVQVPGAEEHVQESLPQFGRTWRIKLTYRF